MFSAKHVKPVFVLPTKKSNLAGRKSVAQNAKRFLPSRHRNRSQLKSRSILALSIWRRWLMNPPKKAGKSQTRASKQVQAAHRQPNRNHQKKNLRMRLTSVPWRPKSAMTAAPAKSSPMTSHLRTPVKLSTKSLKKNHRLQPLSPKRAPKNLQKKTKLTLVPPLKKPKSRQLWSLTSTKSRNPKVLRRNLLK